MAKGNKPVAEFRIGYVKAAVFKNEGSGDSTFYNTTLTRSYKDADDKWQETNQFGHHDLLNAAGVLQKAEAFIAAQAA